jgi:hypothetical protein
MKIEPASASAALALVWFCCFVLSLAVPIVLMLRASIDSTTVAPAVEHISGLYAPHLGVVLAFYFAGRAKARRRKQVDYPPFVAAILISAVWNLLVAGTLVLVLVGQLNIEDALAFAGGIGPNLSWLVAPALGYFFAKPGEPA